MSNETSSDEESKESVNESSLVIKIPLEKVKVKMITKECRNNDSESPEPEDSYARILRHHRKCKVKSKELVKFREMERDTEERKEHMRDMMKFISSNGDIPARFSSKVYLVADDETKQAVLWDGNHRFSCIAKMNEGYPEYVPVRFSRMNLDGFEGIDGALYKVPKIPKTWPTYPCGCHFGFDTKSL